MRQDANGTAHPIHRPVTDKSEASEMFDDITYNKAGAIVRMLEGYLGPEVFRAGVRKYVTDHAYGNTTPADLWRALEAVSGKPVTAVATAFIEQSGVPLVIAETKCIDGAQRIDAAPAAICTACSGASPGSLKGSWQIPIAAELVKGQQPLEPVLLTQAPLEIAAGRCGDAVKLNVGDTGYYRVQYDDAMRAALTRSFAQLAAGGPRQSAGRCLGAGGSRPRLADRLSRSGRTDRRRQPSGLGPGDAGAQADRPPPARSSGAPGVPGACALQAPPGARPYRLGPVEPPKATAPARCARNWSARWGGWATRKS